MTQISRLHFTGRQLTISEDEHRMFTYQLDGAVITRARARELIEQLHEADPGRWERLERWLRDNGLTSRCAATP